MTLFKNILVVAFLTIYGLGFAQTKADVFSDKPFTYLGIDFSNVVYFGDPGTVSNEEMKELFDRINIVVPTEQPKYNIKGAFKRESINYNIESTLEKNKSIDASKLLTYNSKDCKKLTEEGVKKTISEYNFTHGESGMGMMFVLAGMNKSMEEAYMWVTFINIDTKEVILAEPIVGIASGFGFRNHWAGAIKHVIDQIKNGDYKMWKKKHVPSK